MSFLRFLADLADTPTLLADCEDNETSAPETYRALNSEQKRVLKERDVGMVIAAVGHEVWNTYGGAQVGPYPHCAAEYVKLAPRTTYVGVEKEFEVSILLDTTWVPAFSIAGGPDTGSTSGGGAIGDSYTFHVQFKKTASGAPLPITTYVNAVGTAEQVPGTREFKGTFKATFDQPGTYHVMFWSAHTFPIFDLEALTVKELPAETQQAE